MEILKRKSGELSNEIATVYGRIIHFIKNLHLERFTQYYIYVIWAFIFITLLVLILLIPLWIIISPILLLIALIIYTISITPYVIIYLIIFRLEIYLIIATYNFMIGFSTKAITQKNFYGDSFTTQCVYFILNQSTIMIYINIF